MGCTVRWAPLASHPSSYCHLLFLFFIFYSSPRRPPTGAEAEAPLASHALPCAALSRRLHGRSARATRSPMTLALTPAPTRRCARRCCCTRRRAGAKQTRKKPRKVGPGARLLPGRSSKARAGAPALKHRRKVSWPCPASGSGLYFEMPVPRWGSWGGGASQGKLPTYIAGIYAPSPMCGGCEGKGATMGQACVDRPAIATIDMLASGSPMQVLPALTEKKQPHWRMKL